MHPRLAGLGEPVLTYQPSWSVSEVGSREEAHSPLSKLTIPHQQSSISSYTPLPEVYREAAPMLRCSTGQVFRTDTPDSMTLHLAFFEWDGTDTGSVLEAFRHVPEACLGALGMKLVSKEKPVLYTVGGDRNQSTINNQQSSILAPSTTLSFDHTVFHAVGSSRSILPQRVHSFRGVWVSGMDAPDARGEIYGLEIKRLRSIRFTAAATRSRPPRACVVQGTVHGAPNATAAWKAFEQSMLRDLRLEPSR